MLMGLAPKRGLTALAAPAVKASAPWKAASVTSPAVS